MVYAIRSEFSPRQQRLLRQAVVDDHGPGTVLRDLRAFLALVDEHEIVLTGTQQLPRHVLADLNARLARPLQIGLTRPLVKSFPHIQGLFLLLRASGLAVVEGGDLKPRLVVDAQIRCAWEGLNPTEQYCALMETWLIRGHPQIVGEGSRRGRPIMPDTFSEIVWFFSSVPDGGRPIAGNADAEMTLRFSPGLLTLALLELFGWIDVRHGPPEPGKGWRIEAIDRKPLGDALVAALHASFSSIVDHVLELETEDDLPFGVLQPVLQPYWPAWQNNLPVLRPPSRQGTHVFKVSLGRIWRRIAMPHHATLEDLASAILNAVHFDHDHLYRFTYRNRFGAEERLQHSYMDEGPWAADVTIGEVPLRVGQTMTFLFDFGDSWEFNVTLERVDPDLDVQKPTLLESHGVAPDQYGW